jgi:hypothetical protein
MLTAWPALENFEDKPEDSFPLSYYPMFTTFRPPEYAVSHPASADINNKIYNLPFTIAGNGGFNQTRRQISRSVRDGSAQLLSDNIAARIPQMNLQTDAPLKSVAIITSVFNLEAYYQGNKKPLKRIVRSVSKVTYPEE